MRGRSLPEQQTEGGPIVLPDYYETLSAIEGRAVTLPDTDPADYSYTQRLLADQNERVKKLGSETVEFVREDAKPELDRTAFVGEAADLVYSVEVMVAAHGLQYRRVLDELGSRAGSFGVGGYPRWSLLRYPASIMDLRRRAEAIREGGPATTDAERLLTDPDGRVERLGSDVMGLVVAEVWPDVPEYDFLGKAADVVYDTTIMVTARGVPFSDVIDELIYRNKAAQRTTNGE